MKYGNKRENIWEGVYLTLQTSSFYGKNDKQVGVVAQADQY